MDVGNIADPDLIASGDIKGLKSIPQGVHTINGGRGLTDTFERNREICGFH